MASDIDEIGSSLGILSKPGEHGLEFAVRGLELCWGKDSCEGILTGECDTVLRLQKALRCDLHNWY